MDDDYRELANRLFATREAGTGVHTSLPVGSKRFRLFADRRAFCKANMTSRRALLMPPIGLWAGRLCHGLKVMFWQNSACSGEVKCCG